MPFVSSVPSPVLTANPETGLGDLREDQNRKGLWRESLRKRRASGELLQGRLRLLCELSRCCLPRVLSD